MNIMANAVEMSTMRKLVAQLNQYRHEYYNPLSKKPWKMISISHSFPILEKHCAKTFINGLHKKRIVFFGRNYKKW